MRARGSGTGAAPVRAQRDPVDRARDERVARLDAERARALEAAARARRRDAGDAGQPAVERAVEDAQPPAAQRLEREPVGDPGREAEHRLDGRRLGGPHGDGAAHREAERGASARAPSASIAARASSTHQSSRFQDLIRYRTSPKASAGKRGASRRTSHSSDALHVPSTSPPWPPFTHTTAAAASARPGDAELGTGSESLAARVIRRRIAARFVYAAATAAGVRRAAARSRTSCPRPRRSRTRSCRRAPRRSPSRSRARGRRRGRRRVWACAVR